jgi:uncharacterized protein (DUF1778 family)
MARKPVRRASEQVNIRMSPEEAAIIRAAIPKGDLTPVAIQLLLDEARARLLNQSAFDLEVDGRQPAA